MTDELKDPDWDLSRIEYTGEDTSKEVVRTDAEDSDDNKDGDSK